MRRDRSEEVERAELVLGHQVARLAAALDVPVIAEGRIHTPAQAAAAISAGAWVVVVGTAITHPTTITDWFATAVADAGEERHP